MIRQRKKRENQASAPTLRDVFRREIITRLIPINAGPARNEPSNRQSEKGWIKNGEGADNQTRRRRTSEKMASEKPVRKKKRASGTNPKARVQMISTVSVSRL